MTTRKVNKVINSIKSLLISLDGCGAITPYNCSLWANQLRGIVEDSGEAYSRMRKKQVLPHLQFNVEVDHVTDLPTIINYEAALILMSRSEFARPQVGEMLVRSKRLLGLVEQFCKDNPIGLLRTDPILASPIYDGSNMNRQPGSTLVIVYRTFPGATVHVQLLHAESGFRSGYFGADADTTGYARVTVVLPTIGDLPSGTFEKDQWYEAQAHIVMAGQWKPGEITKTSFRVNALKVSAAVLLTQHSEVSTLVHVS